MRADRLRLPLDGLMLPDARTGAPVVLAELPGVQVLTLVRHRY